MKTVLITGATGFLGHHVVIEFLKKEDWMVIAIGGRPEDKANDLPDNERVCFYTLGVFFSKQFHSIDVAINCAFARSHDPELLAQTLDFTERMIYRFIELNVQTVINISSQGVYKRLPTGMLSSEESPIAPIDLYSMVKYTTEKMFRLSEIPCVINVRLASLMMPQRFLYFFLQRAKAGEPFVVTAPNQYASLFDVTDAASGLVAISVATHNERRKIYNLGTGTQYSLMEYAESVKSIGESVGYKVNYEVSDNGTTVCAGMDCSKVMKDTGWKPMIMKDDMIRKLFMSSFK